MPGSDQIEIDLSTDLTDQDNPSTGDASELLGSLPADSVAAFASAEFGKRFERSDRQHRRQRHPGRDSAEQTEEHA